MQELAGHVEELIGQKEGFSHWEVSIKDLRAFSLV